MNLLIYARIEGTIIKPMTDVKQNAARSAFKPFQEYAGIFIFFADALAMSGALSSTGAGELIGGHIAGVLMNIFLILSYNNINLLNFDKNILIINN